MGVGELKRLRGGSDGIDRQFAGFQLGKVDRRIDQDDVPQLAPVWFAFSNQRAPGKEGGLVSSQGLQRVGQRSNGSAKILRQGLAAVDALKDEGKRVRKTAYRRIGRHGCEKRLRLHELSGDSLHLRGRSEE